MPVYLNGLLLGLSLIMALGPQNVFIIRQGALRQYAFLAALMCFFCDFILITASVLGLQSALTSHDSLRVGMMWFGAAFLFYYGVLALKQAFKRDLKCLDDEPAQRGRRQIILLALGFSLLNPHAILDSLILIGGGSSLYPGYQHLFLLGVLSSSFLWFSLLTLSAFYFSQYLSKAHVWRRIELLSGSIMLFLSIKLLLLAVYGG
jgi:L-lysine exporter family protein LysE/ArgO